MDNLTWGNPAAHRVRVHFISTSTTIYEGMPVCYNYDTTTNWAGGSVSNGAVTASSTLTAGTPETGAAKYIEVETPATANLQWFAGVVAKGGWCGKTTSSTSGVGQLLDIYVPNGAIVPVRSYISSTETLNALAIQNGQNYFGDPAAGMTNGAARYVAVAMETVDRSSAAGLCLARLCPNEFLYQSAGSSKLEFVETATVDIAANFINVHSSQASGGFTGLWVRSEVDTAANSDTSIAIYGEANLLGVAAGDCYAGRFALNIWGGTQTQNMCAFQAEIYEQDANLSSASLICPIYVRTQIDATNAPAANTHYMMYFRADGADKPDGLFKINQASDIKFEAVTTGTTASHHIPIRVGSTTYYILVEDTA